MLKSIKYMKQVNNPNTKKKKNLENKNEVNDGGEKKTLNEEKDRNIISNINYGITKEDINIYKKKRNNNERQETLIIRKVKRRLNETPSFTAEHSFSFQGKGNDERMKNNKKVEDIDNNIVRIDNHRTHECSFDLQKQEREKQTNDTNRRIYNSAKHNNNRVRRELNNKGCCDKLRDMCRNKQCQII